MLSNLVNRS